MTRAKSLGSITLNGKIRDVVEIAESKFSSTSKITHLTLELEIPVFLTSGLLPFRELEEVSNQRFDLDLPIGELRRLFVGKEFQVELSMEDWEGHYHLKALGFRPLYPES